VGDKVEEEYENNKKIFLSTFLARYLDVTTVMPKRILYEYINLIWN